MTVLGVDARRTEAPPSVKDLRRPADLHTLLPQADFVIMTVPHTPETRGMMAARELRLMKKTAFLINIGRGACVVLDDLVAALRAGDIAGAGLDEEPDEAFYTMPRKVVHIDDAAIAAIKQCLPDVLPPNGVVLDLLSSWRSHWPEGLPKQRLVGLGLNVEEMADNPDLDEYVVHNVNTDPQLPFETDIFDAVVLTVSIQYI